MALERIATDTYDFERIRTTGLTYVDKTAILYPLVEGNIGRQFFLSRPRRFGKSLLISTVQKLFEGRRDLFEGLAIDSLPWDWSDTHPVLRLDMSLCSGETVEEVEASVEFTLRREAERLGVSLRDGGNLRDRFAALVEDLAAASPSGQVVLLVDEYDKPLTRWVGCPEVAPLQAFLNQEGAHRHGLLHPGWLRPGHLRTGPPLHTRRALPDGIPHHQTGLGAGRGRRLRAGLPHRGGSEGFNRWLANAYR